MQLEKKMSKNKALNKEVLCVIPARGGSKGIPRKNIKSLAGKPLIYYSITAALQSKSVSRAIVSTEDNEIAKIAKEFGADVPFLRPEELAKDNVHSVYVTIDVLEKLKERESYAPDVVIMLLPTSPLATSKHIDDAVSLYFQHNKGSVISVCPFELPILAIRKIEKSKIKPLFNVKNFNVRRQDAELYFVNAALYIAKPEDLIKNQTFHGDEVYPYIMSKEDSLDINDEHDFKIAEFIISKKHTDNTKQFFRSIKSIDLIVYDFDGVMTDNRVFVSKDGRETVRINRADGLGINMIKKLGISQLILSTEKDPIVAVRAKKVGLPVLHSIDDKKEALANYCHQHNFSLKKVIYIGNDMNDYDVMNAVGIPVAPADAHINILNLAKVVLNSKGGYGVIRELADHIIDVNNKSR
jgi:N-acylneuraminate cytidylyltransferase